MKFDHSLFFYNPEDKVFVAWHSDLGSPDFRLDFSIRGKKHEVKFTFSETIRDIEGDVMFWKYKTSFLDKHIFDGTVHVYND